MKWGHWSILSFEKIPFNSKLGYFLILLSAALAALVHVVAKPLLGSSGIDGFAINPVLLAALIYIINGLFFTPIARNSNSLHQIGSRNLFLMILIGIAEASALISYFFGLKDTTAINASIFSNGEIIFSLLIAIVVLRERLRKKELMPFSMIIVGMMILPVMYDFYQHGMTLADVVLGDLLIIFAGFLYAIDVNISKYVSDRFESKRITQITSFASGGFAFTLVFIFQIPLDMNIEQIPTIALIAIVGTGLSTLLFLISLRLLGSMRTVLLYSTTSVIGIMLSSVILAEEITLINIISISLVMTGVFYLRNRLGEEGESKSNFSTSLNFEKLRKFSLPLKKS